MPGDCSRRLRRFRRLGRAARARAPFGGLPIVLALLASVAVAGAGHQNTPKRGGAGLRHDPPDPRAQRAEDGTARAAATDDKTVITFDRTQVGVMPRTFQALSSEEQEPGRWQVARLGGEIVLSQVSLGRNGYRLAVLDGSRQDNLRAGVRLKVGKGDRAAGLAWRVRDAANYYAARIDLAEREFVLHKFVRGNRVSLQRLQGLRLPDAAWHEIVVEHIGERIRVWLNGIPVANERDDGLKEAGMVGFWMPADSTCHYSRLWFEPIRKD